MNYRKSIYFLSLVVAAGFWACSKPESGDSGVSEPPVAAEEGYIAFGLDLTGSEESTRSFSDGEEWGSTEENYVNTVRLILYGAKPSPTNENDLEYDPSETVVRYAFDFNIESKTTESGEINGYRQYHYSGNDRTYAEAGNVAWPVEEGRPHLYASTSSTIYDGDKVITLHDGFITWARGVVADDYKMLLIINPTSATDDALDLYKITAVGSPIELLYTAVEMDQADLRDKGFGGVAAPDYFLMTNHMGLVDVPKRLLQKTETLANLNPVPVYVSRAVAKVTVTQAEDIEVSPQGASIGDIRWDVSATNKLTYWMRKSTALIDEGSKGSSETSESGRINLYAEDPNYTTGAAEKTANYNYLTGNTPALAHLTEEDGYILENTMDSDYNGYPASFIEQSDELSTLWISCVYTPAGIEEGGSYYVWNNYVFPASDIKGYAADPETIPDVPALENLKADIEAASLGGLDLTKDDFSASFSGHGFQYYHEGVGYHSFVIEHNAPGDATTPGYGYYGVVRNMHYEYQIKKISGPGRPTIEPGGVTYGGMEIAISLNQWQDREQSSSGGNPIISLR